MPKPQEISVSLDVPNQPTAFDRRLADLLAWPVERRVLENGLTLIVVPDFRNPVVSLQAWVKTGSIHEGSLLGSGLSHYLEHLMFKGTERRGPLDISRQIHALGGYVNAYTTFDRTVYYIDVPAMNFASAADILTDQVFHSQLPAEEVANERNVILREIAMTEDDPDRQLSRALFETAFREHPYREPVIGHRELFKKVGRDELADYYQRRYSPSNVVMIIAGAVELETACAEIEKLAGDLPRVRGAPVFVPEEPAQLAPRERRETGEVTLERGGLAYRVPHLAHPDAPALNALASALGDGDSSLLWQELREKRRLVHEIHAACWNPGSAGLFWISYTCEPGKTSEVERAIREVIQNAAEQGISLEALAKARRRVAAGEVNARKTVSGIAAQTGLAEVVIGDLGYSKVYFEKMRQLTAETVTDCLRRHLITSKLSRVSLSPKTSRITGAVNQTPASLPDFELLTLANGVRILLQPDRSLPKVHLRSLSLGGPTYETPETAGITQLLATCLTRDTENRSAAEVANAIDSAGATFAEVTGNNTFGLKLEMLSGDEDLGLEILSDALFRPNFKAASVDAERASQIAELEEELEDPFAHGRLKIREKFFAGHPFASHPLGSPEALRNLDLEALEGHRARLLDPGNLVLVATGDFDRNAMANKLRALGESAGPPRGFVVSTSDPSVPPEVGEHEIRLPREQAIALEAFPCPGVQAEYHVFSEILDELLSGMASRLFERVRDELGLAYFVGALRLIGLNRGMFLFYAGTRSDALDAVYGEFASEIARFKNGGIEEKELREVRHRLLTARLFSEQRLGNRAMRAGLNCLYGLPVNDNAIYREKLEAATVGNLAEFAQDQFRDEQRVRLSVLPV